MFSDILKDLLVRVLFKVRDRRLCWPTSSPTASSRGWHALQLLLQPHGPVRAAFMLSGAALTICQCISELGVILLWLSSSLESHKATCETTSCCGCRRPAWGQAYQQLQHGRPCGQPHAAEPPRPAAHKQGDVPECCSGRQAVPVAWQACAPAAVLQGR